ncbi:hypothetical protein MMC22_008726 [Lobaria immixta]|nr:hypothetical protein [Lobaria immixta]
MSPQRAQKLKDACDVCSTSKVKCDKRRPICSRCDKLAYSCFYSAARRKGRPHPPKNQGSQRNPVEPEERPSEEQRDAAEGEVMPSRTGLPKSVEPHLDTGANARELHHTNYQQNPDPHLHYQQGTLARTNSSDLSSYSNAETCANIDRTDLMDIFFPHTDATTSNLPKTDAGSTIDVQSTISSYSDHSINPECSDCVTVAMSMLQHLTMTSMQPLPLSSSTSTSTCSLASQHHLEPNAPLDLDTLLNTASTAIKRLSTILICPCSCKIDVGLLNAALCGAILDLYDTILRSSFDPPKSQSSSTPTANDMGLCVAKSSLRGGANESRQVTRVLEELPKVANLVMQFAQRYSSAFSGRAGTAGLELEDEEEGEGAADLLLPALAASQKTRLRSIIHEATNWLAQV